jgi:hypothetical protein
VIFFRRVLCEFFVFFVVKFYHGGHKGNTKFTKKTNICGMDQQR